MKTQILPDPQCVDAFIEHVVSATLEKIARDARRKIVAEIWTCVRDECTLLRVAEFGKLKLKMSAAVRLRFREAHAARIIMFCETRFPIEEAVASCSGFFLKGDMRPDELPKRTGLTILYNDWQWSGWSGVN